MPLCFLGLPGFRSATNDNPLVIGQTIVQSRHVAELRDAINSLRSHLGLAAYSWQTSAAVGALIKADPIVEMRTALDQALGAPSGGYRTALRGHQPQICSCLFSLRKAARLVESGDEARRRHRADPRHRAQTSDYFVAIGELGELLVRPLDLL